MCALEILSMANLVNYFGKSETVDEVTIYPILIEKGMFIFSLFLQVDSRVQYLISL